MIYKKSVVLSSVNSGKERGVATFEYDGGEIIGNVRLYNFNKEPEGILSLGLLCDKKVLKAGLVKESSDFYTFKLNGEKQLNAFSCALVNIVKGEAVPTLLGSTNGTSQTMEKLCNSLSIFDEDPTYNSVKNKLDNEEVFLEDQEEIDKFIDLEMSKTNCVNNCSECKYRDAFFKLADDTTPAPEKEETFYDTIKEQLDELFNKYEEDDILKQIIPDSKWVKIDFEEKGEYYVVGLLYENNEIKYVCYGVPSMYQDEPPKHLKGFCQWLPIDTTKENGFGYWITYQDAKSGENLIIDYETI